ncbi:MAG: ribosome silencing factor [Deltaproteobacteria bacterium]|nr:ribosome silencing factor [Deltaproteobacteria bacterium]
MTQDSDSAFAAQIDIFIEVVLGRKAYDLVVLDVRKLTTIADVFVLCSGRSNRQVKAIADHVQEKMKAQGIYSLGVEGKSEGHWVLLDFGHVIIHIFYEPIREFYDLEGLWRDAGRMQTPALEKAQEQKAQEDATDGQ